MKYYFIECKRANFSIYQDRGVTTLTLYEKNNSDNQVQYALDQHLDLKKDSIKLKNSEHEELHNDEFAPEVKHWEVHFSTFTNGEFEKFIDKLLILKLIDENESVQLKNAWNTANEIDEIDDFTNKHESIETPLNSNKVETKKIVESLNNQNKGKPLFLLEGCCVNQLVQMNESEQWIKNWINFYGPMLEEFVEKHSSDGTIIISEPRFFEDTLGQDRMEKLRLNLKNKFNINILFLDPREPKDVVKIHKLIDESSEFYNRNFAVFYNWSSEAQFRPKNQELYEKRIQDNKPTDVSMLLGIKVEHGDIFLMDPLKETQPIIWKRSSHLERKPPQLPINIDNFQDYRNLTNIVSQLNSFTLENQGWFYRKTIVAKDGYSVSKNEQDIAQDEKNVINLIVQLKVCLCKFYKLEKVLQILELYIDNNQKISNLLLNNQNKDLEIFGDELKFSLHLNQIKIKAESLKKRGYNEAGDAMKTTYDNIKRIYLNKNNEIQGTFNLKDMKKDIKLELKSAINNPKIKEHWEAKVVLANFFILISVVGLIGLAFTSTNRNSFWLRPETHSLDQFNDAIDEEKENKNEI